MSDDGAGTDADFVDSADPELDREGPDGLAYYRGEPLNGSVYTLDSEGGIGEIAAFRDGLRSTEVFYFLDGRRAEERTYVEGRPFDEWQAWHPDGTLAWRELYSWQGRLRWRTRWSESGEVLEDTDVERAERGIDAEAVREDDARVSWLQDGSRWFLDDEPLTGQVIERAGPDPRAPIVAVQSHRDGYYAGPQRTWFADGPRRTVGLVWRNRPAGLFLEWYATGALSEEKAFDAESELLERRAWDASGAVTAEWRGGPRESTVHRETWPDGAPKLLGVRGPAGRIGAWVSFAPGGQVVGEDYFSPEGELVAGYRWDEAGNPRP
ncbi:toxin-antitoxin system YwqK family antitoxin [Nocardia thailandica]